MSAPELEFLAVSRFRGHAESRAASKRLRIELMRRIADPDLFWLQGLDPSYCATSFGAGTAKFVLDIQVRQYVLAKVEQMWQHGRKGFPGSLAVSLMSADVDQLRHHEYVCLPKTDGERYMMVCFRDEDRRPTCAFVERTGEVYILQMVLHQRMFDGGIYDCELARAHDGTWILHVFDCIVHAGTVIAPLDYEARLRACNDAAHNMCQNSHPARCFDMRAKSATPVDAATAMLHEDSDGIGPIDGVILVRAQGRYRAGKDTTLFKFKKRHTIDLKIIPDLNKELQMCAIDSQTKQLVAVQPLVPTVELLARLGVTNPIHLAGTVVECEWCAAPAEPAGWRPFKLRSKTKPNNLFTVQRTRQNIVENLAWADVLIAINASQRERDLGAATPGAGGADAQYF